MQRIFRYSTRSTVVRPFCSTAAVLHEDIRERLAAGVKTAMRNRDSTASTTLRSVLSEVYNLDKLSGSKVSPSAIVGVLRKAVLRRTESTREFVKGGRPDLAEKESHEVDIISAFLPPLLSESDIDRVLKAAIVECPQDNANPRKMLGVVLKSFYSKVDKATVDNDLVKRKAEILLNISSSGQPVL